jgi:SOS-response transcriptional repressor LexA
MTDALRPTKKQRELLTFIEQFIGQHGYSPSYREIMAGLSYTSVATVALHVNSLIKRGHLRKRDHSARSLEVVGAHALPDVVKLPTNVVKPGEEKWLVEKIEHYFSEAEKPGTAFGTDEYERLQMLVGALKALDLDGAAQSFAPRLAALKQRLPQA